MSIMPLIDEKKEKNADFNTLYIYISMIQNSAKSLWLVAVFFLERDYETLFILLTGAHLKKKAIQKTN